MSKRAKFIGAAACAAAAAAAAPAAATCPPPPAVSPGPATQITWTAFAVTDVSLDGQMYHKAFVTLTFVGDSSDVTPFCETNTSDGNSGSGWSIQTGTASVRIVSGGRTVQASFLPNQILVSYDWLNGGAGFSSYVGADHHLEPAYPLAMAGSTVLFGMPDLTTTGVWSGHAWSCIGYPPARLTGVCADPSGYPLQTDRGAFFVSMPYVSYSPPKIIWDDYKSSLNNGFFSTLVVD